MADYLDIDDLLSKYEKDKSNGAVKDIPSLPIEDIVQIEKAIIDLEKEYFSTIKKVHIGKLEEFNIYLVDGDVIKKELEMDFCEGGNPFRYPEFVPDNELWIDMSIHTPDIKFILLHEFVESKLMSKLNMKYDPAHTHANAAEKNFRKKFTIE